MTLRSRLLAGLLGLCLLGLAAAGIGTYVALRSFLFQQIDRQLITARGSAERALTSQTGGTVDASALKRVAPDTFIELRSSANQIVAVSQAGFRGQVTPAPQLPAVLHPPPQASSASRFRSGSRFDVNARTGSGSFRVLVSSFGHSGEILVVAAPLGTVTSTLGRLVLVEALIAGAVLVFLGLGSFWLLRSGLRPLESIAETAGGIAHGDLDVRVSPADERTEVGRLGAALNGMLERLEEAFSRRDQSEAQLRRFLSSASHELRTPLTSIRGYAALFRRGAAESPEDLKKAMARIESEATRMGELIEDLLLLARLDEERPLERERVDLTKIALDAAQDAHVRDPGRSVTVHENGPVIVTGDERRLRQVASNLLENALVHTPPGTAVQVEVQARGGQGVVAVVDDGPGLDPEQASRVFERFYRATPSSTRGNAPASVGTGLGLAIVQAIMHAHHGTATVRSRLGEGARFEITLALADPTTSSNETPVAQAGASAPSGGAQA